MPVLSTKSRVFVAGHRGLVGSALVRRLEADGFESILTRTRQQLDLTDSVAVKKFFATEQPDVVILAAAKVGGIHANNTYPAEFIQQNLGIQNNVIHQSWVTGVSNLLFLGSSCIYPRDCPQPISEDYLLTGPLEPTNRAYAVAKIAGYEMCRSYQQQYGVRFSTAMPTNLYGPNDNFNPQNSHVLPGLIYKAHQAKHNNDPHLEIWGSGTPLREFLHVDDLAEACLHLLNLEERPDLVNIGSANEVSVKDLAKIVCEVVGFSGKLHFNPNMPDGTPRKRVDTGRMEQLGWRAKTGLRDGIESTYEWFKQQLNDGKLRTNA